MRSVAATARRVEREQAAEARRQPTADSFQNFIAHVGLGTDNQSSASTYGFAPLTRERVKLEWMYRGSWLARRAVGCLAEDMTREWVKFGSTLPPDDGAQLQNALIEAYEVPSRINDTIKWSRLYGGAGAAMLIDGQKPEEPLRLEAIGKGQFNGLLVLDRWMLEPSLGDLVTDQKSKDLGRPKYYRVTADAPALPRMEIHHSRFLRFDGDEIPYWQRLTENLWGLSILEPLYDRLVAFDSTTQGAAQLVYRAYLRCYKVPKLREIIASGGQIYEALLQQLKMIRTFQTNEGLSVIDAEDDMSALTYSFGGLSDVLGRFEEQLSGALDTPLVRLFGQSPGGLSSDGESALHTYYDSVKNRQEKQLRPQLSKLFPVVARSEGIQLPDDFGYDFNPLWQMREPEKAQVGAQVTGAVVQAHDAGIVSTATALKELKQSSEVTGVWTNVTDEDIEAAEAAPPVPQMGEVPPDFSEQDPSESEPPASENQESEPPEVGPRLRLAAAT